MSIYIAEFKKIFIKNKMLILALLVISFCVFSEFSSNTYTTMSSINTQKYYDSCIENISGKYSDEKENYINELKGEFSGADAKLSSLSEELAKGKITADDYLKEYTEYSSVKAGGDAVTALQNDLSYVKKDTDHHYFIDSLNWTQVFQNFGFNFVLMLFVLILSVNSVMVEYKSDMTVINSVSKKGRQSGGRGKMLTVVVFTALMTILFSIIHLVAYSQKYDLTGWNYPIQSLTAYSGVSKDMTIGGGYLLVSIIKVIGYCSFAVFTMLFTTIFKKSVPAMTFSLAVVLVPMYILNSNTEAQSLYLLPFPIGSMISTGYIMGTNKEDFGENYFFREVTISQLIAVLSVLVVVSVLMAIYVSRKMSGKTFNLKLLKKAPAFVLSLIMTFTMCSCSGDFENANEGYVLLKDYNLIYSKADKYFIKADEIPTDYQGYIGFVDGECAYIQNEGTIYEMNLKTLEKSEFAKISTDYDSDGFLGLEDLVPSLSGAGVDTNMSLLSYLEGGYKGRLYFSNIENGISEYNISNGTVNILVAGADITKFKIAGNFGYYLNSNKFMKINLDTGEETLLTTNLVSDYAVTDEDIFYINQMDKNYVYSLDTSSPVFSIPCKGICANENNIVCSTAKGIFKITHNSSDLITKENTEKLYSADEEYIYYSTYENDTAYLKICDYNGDSKKIIIK